MPLVLVLVGVGLGCGKGNFFFFCFGSLMVLNFIISIHYGSLWSFFSFQDSRFTGSGNSTLFQKRWWWNSFLISVEYAALKETFWNILSSFKVEGEFLKFLEENKSATALYSVSPLFSKRCYSLGLIAVFLVNLPVKSTPSKLLFSPPRKVEENFLPVEGLYK